MRIAIIDESTGRLKPDRQWSEGLHQFLELKEGLDPGEIRTTLGRITFQRFLPRYRHLCGMTGTARAALPHASPTTPHTPLPCTVRAYRAVPELIAGYGVLFMHDSQA